MLKHFAYHPLRILVPRRSPEEALLRAVSRGIVAASVAYVLARLVWASGKGFVWHFPARVLGKGFRAPGILANLEKTRQNMVGPCAEYPNLGFPSVSVAFRDAPRRSAAPFVWPVVSHFPSFPFGCSEKGRTAPEILHNLAKIHQNMADPCAG